VENDCAVLFLTHEWKPIHAMRFRRIRENLAGIADCHVIFQSSGDEAEDAIVRREAGNVHFFRPHELIERLGYGFLTNNGVVPGCPHFTLIDFSHAHRYRQYWCIENDVEFTGNWATLLGACEASTAGLIASHVRSYEQTSDWFIWKTVVLPTMEDVEAVQLAGGAMRAFMPVYRISHEALQAIDARHRSNWIGHFEALLPTSTKIAGLGIADLNECGTFYRGTEQDPARDFTKQSTMRWRPPVALNYFIHEYAPDTLFHPVKESWTYDNGDILMIGRQQNRLLRLKIGELVGAAETMEPPAIPDDDPYSYSGDTKTSEFNG
jgi:hypothetical protein